MQLSELLLEHVINLHTQEDKKKYVDKVWDMLQLAYKPSGGFKSASSKDELIDDSSIWKLIRRGNKIVSVTIYKNKNGRKLIALATDNSDQGKIDLVKIVKGDLEHKRAWAEVSGAVEKMMQRLGGEPISNKMASELTGKEILGYDVDGFHYTRLINGVAFTKIIYGFHEIPEVPSNVTLKEV